MDQPSSTESNALTLRIKFKSATLEEFIGRYGVDVSPGGIFIRTKQPVDVGTSLQFEFLLADGSALLAGLGTVAWVRENDPTRANNVPGMGLRFDKLTPESQQNHQTILAEKARKEGKPQGTPYPPTSFVVPASRPATASETTRSVPAPTLPPEAKPEPPKPEAPPVNFAKTLPAPAALASRLQHSSQPSGEFGVDDFDGGGKTEISDKPLDYFIQEAEAAEKAEAAAAAAAAAPAATAAASKTDLGEWKADAQTLEGVNAPPAPDEVSISDSQAYATAAPEAPAALRDSGERRPSDKAFFTSLLESGERSATAATKPDESGSGVPLETTMPEKTEELSFSSARMSDDAVEPIDLGAPSVASNESLEAPIPSLGDFASPEKKRPRGNILLIGGVLAAGAAAFAAVYVWQTKPWVSAGSGEAPAAVGNKASAPAPSPSGGPAAKPTAAEAPSAKPAEPKPTAEKKPAAEKPKPVAVEKPAVQPEKVAAAAKPAADDQAEKQGEAKPAAEPPTAQNPTEGKPAPEKTAKKPEGGRPAGSRAKATRVAAATGSEAAGAEKAGAAGDQEEVYRLSFRSVPIGAEVLIDGEYFARTPCERRILDPKKTLAITIRKEGYEPHERMIGSSDNWAKKGDGNERVLSVSVTLKKVKAGEPAAAAPAAPPEEKPPVKAPSAPEPDKI